MPSKNTSIAVPNRSHLVEVQANAAAGEAEAMMQEKGERLPIAAL